MENLKEHDFLKTFDKKHEKDFTDRFWAMLKEAQDKYGYILWKDETKGKAQKILSIFGHHFNSSLSNLDFCKVLHREGKRTKEDVANRENAVREELCNAIDYMEGVLSDNPSDRIEIYEYGTKVTYIAVKEGKDSYKIRTLLTKEGIPAEIKRVKSILKSRGPWYYECMLEELNTGDYKKYYYVVE